MKVTINNFNDNMPKKMVEYLVKLIEIREKIKINYEIVKK